MSSINTEGFTPVEVAMGGGHTEIVKLLISKGADISPLHLAIYLRDEARAKSLIESGADVNKQTPNGTTPLNRAVGKGLKDISELLIEHGADVNKQTPNGTTPLNRAVGKGFKDISELLIEHGADVNAGHFWGWTPLHSAAKNGYKDIVELLMAHGANVNAKDGDRRTPLYYAKEKGHTEIVELLRKQGPEFVSSSDQKHDLSITGVSAPSRCSQDYSIPVTVNIENQGNCSESFVIKLADVTDGLEIGSKSLTLAATGQGGIDEICDMILDPPSGGRGFFGAQIDSGDVNGDGNDDLLIGAQVWNDERGRVYLYYGGTNMDTNPDKVFEGENPGDMFGHGVCLGDVNGDGLDDIIIGAIAYNNWRGKAYIFYSGQGKDLNRDFTIDGEAGIMGGRLGRAIDAGDVNGDNYEDILITAPRSDTQSWEGRAYLYYGGSPMDTNTVKVLKGENDRDFFGVVAAIGGDVDGDGYADILVGNCAPWLSKRQGKAYLFYGAPGKSMDEVPDMTFYGDELANDDFATCVNLFDIDKDGHADVLISARRWSDNRGRAYVYWGNSRAAMDNVPDLTFTGPADTRSMFGGNTICAGYVNNDRFGDILVGAYIYNRGSMHGSIYVFYGGTKTFVDTDYDHALYGNVPKSRFGRTAKLCDLNGDGFDDAVVGGYSYNDEQGRVWIYHNNPPSQDNVTFYWDTTNASPGKHTLKATIAPVSGEENVADNSMIVEVEVKEDPK